MTVGRLGVVAMVDQLVELLARPGGGRFGADVVQDAQVGGADLVVVAVEGGCAVGRKGGAQIVEQVRHANEEADSRARPGNCRSRCPGGSCRARMDRKPASPGDLGRIF